MPINNINIATVHPITISNVLLYREAGSCGCCILLIGDDVVSVIVAVTAALVIKVTYRPAFFFASINRILSISKLGLSIRCLFTVSSSIYCCIDGNNATTLDIVTFPHCFISSSDLNTSDTCINSSFSWCICRSRKNEVLATYISLLGKIPYPISDFVV